jgi:hypothetical protein
MKKVEVKFSRPVRILVNGSESKPWAKIVCNSTGKVLHIGQPNYIKKVAMGRYNSLPSF